jgi:hypothetical protein
VAISGETLVDFGNASSALSSSAEAQAPLDAMR